MAKNILTDVEYVDETQESGLDSEIAHTADENKMSGTGKKKKRKSVKERSKGKSVRVHNLYLRVIYFANLP